MSSKELAVTSVHWLVRGMGCRGDPERWVQLCNGFGLGSKGKINKLLKSRD